MLAHIVTHNHRHGEAPTPITYTHADARAWPSPMAWCSPVGTVIPRHPSPLLSPLSQTPHAAPPHSPGQPEPRWHRRRVGTAGGAGADNEIVCMWGGHSKGRLGGGGHIRWGRQRGWGGGGAQQRRLGTAGGAGAENGRGGRQAGKEGRMWGMRRAEQGASGGGGALRSNKLMSRHDISTCGGIRSSSHVWWHTIKWSRVVAYDQVVTCGGIRSSGHV